TFAQSLLQFVEIKVVPATGIADDNDRFGFHAPACHGPEILVVIQSGTITDRATVEFPSARRRDNDQNDDNSDAAPRNLRDRALEFERWTAVDALGFRRSAEEQMRQPKDALKIGSR